MPPKLKTGKKGKGKKGKKGKKKKEKVVIPNPPLHYLTELYNILREKAYDLKRTEVTVNKKRLEGWYMTREMLNMKHDNQVYHDHLDRKMMAILKLIQEISAQLEKEKADVERLIRERMADYDRKIAEYRARIIQGESVLSELKFKLLEFEPMIKKLAGLMAKLKELESQIPAAELEANIKTRHLKNQYLNERAALHNHLEAELYKLITTCRAYLMPILSEHMYIMEMDNRRNRYELRALDVDNFHFSQQKEELLEIRNSLNMERGYLSMDWVFNKLAACEVRKKAEKEARIKAQKLRGRTQTPVEDCELSVIFQKYLNLRLEKERHRKEREARMKKRREEKQRKLEIEQEKIRKEMIKAALLAKKQMEELEELEQDYDEMDEGDDLEEMEYYEDSEGNLVIATTTRMREHKSLMQNKIEEDTEDEDDDDDDDSFEEDDWEDEESSETSSQASSNSSLGSRESDFINVNPDEQDYGQDDDDDDTEASEIKLK